MTSGAHAGDDARGDDFTAAGWCRFPHDPALARWVGRSMRAAREAVRSPGHARWLRCGGTWFAGVNALPNDDSGRVAGGIPITGTAVEFIGSELGLAGFGWDRAQVSVCYPGYPRRSTEDTEASFGYRRRRDAAHVDGLLREGPKKRRHLREHHGFVLGVPMTAASPGASPLVVWEGSHRLARETFREVFAGIAPGRWGEIDVTEIYQEMRRRIFDTCRRVVVHAGPGEAYLVHRLTLHGIAPWAPGATASADGRMICYFRPVIGGPREWLESP